MVQFTGQGQSSGAASHSSASRSTDYLETARGAEAHQSADRAADRVDSTAAPILELVREGRSDHSRSLPRHEWPRASSAVWRAAINRVATSDSVALAPLDSLRAAVELAEQDVTAAAGGSTDRVHLAAASVLGRYSRPRDSRPRDSRPREGSRSPSHGLASHGSPSHGLASHGLASQGLASQGLASPYRHDDKRMRAEDLPADSRSDSMNRPPDLRGSSYLPAHSSQAVAAPFVTFEESKRINRSICEARSAGEIEQICLNKLDQFDAVNLSTALHRLAKEYKKTGQRGDMSLSVIDNVAQKAISLIRYFKPQELTNTAWALATLGICNDRLMRAVAQSAESRIQAFKPQELANMAWAFATLDICERTLMRAIAQSSEIRIAEFKSQNLANMAWAFAKLGIREDRMMSLLAHSAESKILEFSPQELSNTAWAFATLGIGELSLMRAVCRSAEIKLSQFTPQNLSNMAWSFATLGIREDGLMKGIAQLTESRIAEFSPQNLANMAWAFATLGICRVELMGKLAAAAEGKIREFNPQDLSNTAWAFAKLGIYNEKMMKALARSVESKVGGFTPQNLSNTAWAFATLSIRDDSLMSVLARAATARIGEFDSQTLANTAWAFASLGLREDGMIRALAQAAESRIQEFTTLGLVNIAWALALLENEAHPIFRSIERVLGSRSYKEFSAIEIRQLLQAQLALELYGVDVLIMPINWHLVAPVRDSAISYLQLDVGLYLKDLAQSLSKEMKTESFIPEIDHSVDFTVGEIAFEVDGPSHFAVEGRGLLGPALFRNRLLKKVGWKLVCIPYWEWNALKTAEEKRRYLDQKIEGIWK